ncbi:Methyltransferase domain-containing protein [Sinosporangium album]|uniref:Methyltransferase domain-containing protein n=1 Tax=Sinosporangium album TaxID=504805 RepID=A0A1G7ZE11_9ACTN|nr:methyltransferase domain-containing protein [Sinosporangium album]SDH06797.1 Methyltransferase domain-containing protein [Sinosporangium album]
MRYDDIDSEAVWNRLGDDHPVLGPVSEDSVDRLLRRARLKPGARVLDLGCGLGAWVLRALELHPDAVGHGVDVSAPHIAEAQDRAKDRGLDARAAFQAADARAFTSRQPYDLVMCVGLSDAFGGLRRNLDHLRPLVAPGGVALVGEPFWEREPDERALAALGVEASTHTGLAGTVDRFAAAGWAPVHAHISSAAEWDDFQWACVGALARWGLDAAAPSAPAGVGSRDILRTARDGQEILRYMADYRDTWLRAWRGTLGFATFLLRPVPPWAAFLRLPRQV